MRAAAAALLLCAGAVAALGARAAPVEVSVTDGAGRPLPGAVVFLDSAEARAQVRPMAEQAIVQTERQFQPRVSVVTRGTPVGFPNRDTVRHHVYSFSETKRFEIKLYVGTPADPVVFDRAGIAVLGCNIHDQMAAWVVVVDTPWHGRTADDGRWADAGVPAGRYRLRVWHPGLPDGAPPLDQALDVRADGARAAVRLAGVAP